MTQRSFGKLLMVASGLILLISLIISVVDGETK